MIIKHPSDNKEHFICPNTACDVNPDKKISTFYSYRHAIDFGWVPTKDTKYSETGEPIFVCPNCCKRKEL